MCAAESGFISLAPRAGRGTSSILEYKDVCGQGFRWLESETRQVDEKESRRFQEAVAEGGFV